MTPNDKKLKANQEQPKMLVVLFPGLEDPFGEVHPMRILLDP